MSLSSPRRSVRGRACSSASPRGWRTCRHDVRCLAKSYFEPWLDTDTLSGGELWDERICEELDAADFTLVSTARRCAARRTATSTRKSHLARERDHRVRGPFLIPLRTAEISTEDRIAELSEYQEMPLRPTHFDEDMAKVISSMRRDLQRRQR